MRVCERKGKTGLHFALSSLALLSCLLDPLTLTLTLTRCCGALFQGSLSLSFASLSRENKGQPTTQATSSLLFSLLEDGVNGC